MLRRISTTFLLGLLFPGIAWTYEPGSQPAAAAQFTFAWPLNEGAPKPRGATTRGAPIVLDTAPAAAWQRLREPGLTDRERDRRAILAMAGPYRVSFDFLEIVRFDPALKPDAPYQSWGTEYVFVFARTEPFWTEVRAAWRELERRDGRYTLKAQVDQGQLFVPFFDYAGKLSDGGAFDRVEARAFVERTLRGSYLTGTSKPIYGQAQTWRQP